MKKFKYGRGLPLVLVEFVLISSSDFFKELISVIFSKEF